MAIASFQRALYDLIANPAFCIDAKADPGILAAKYDLTRKELERLNQIIRQRGMAANCTLYRINRVTPIYTLMPYTCKVLDDKILPVLTSFWNTHARTTMQFKDEVSLFCQFLKSKIAAGEVAVPYLEEVLHFETTVNELRYQKRETRWVRNAATSRFVLNPQVRVVPFQHHPKELFAALTSGSGHPLPKLRPGTYYLLLRQHEEEVDMNVISDEMGAILTHIENYNELPAALLETGLVWKNE